MKRNELTEYFELMESFQTGQTDAEQFEKRYLSLFKSDQRQLPRAVFMVLNELFSDVDMFVSDPRIRTHDDLNQDQLLRCSQNAYTKLTALTENE